MERNQITEIKNLAPGDRFYKLTDKTKKVYQKVQAKTKTTQYQTYSHFATARGEKFPQPFKSNTAVVFLRSALGAFLYCLSSCKNLAQPLEVNHAMLVNLASLLFFIWIALCAYFSIRSGAKAYRHKHKDDETY
ncbi:hypothetical protein [Pelobium manganitolerans]|uniref:hypothetical protein n=1 Tax=Pelobium manganitolerans TaxID=1842495 RepID=UPI003FA3916A